MHGVERGKRRRRQSLTYRYLNQLKISLESLEDTGSVYLSQKDQRKIQEIIGLDKDDPASGENTRRVMVDICQIMIMQLNQIIAEQEHTLEQIGSILYKIKGR